MKAQNQSKNSKYKILVCTHEFPFCSISNQKGKAPGGLGGVVENVVKQLRKKGFICSICSPIGPEVTLGNWTLIEKLGGLGILYYWFRVQNFFSKIKKEYDIVWLNNPLFLGKIPFNHPIVTIHSTYYGFDTILANKISHSFLRKIYFKIMKFVERLSLKKLAYKHNADFISVGKTTTDELLSIGIRDVQYISNGVDFKKFRNKPRKNISRQHLNIPQTAIVLLSLSRITHQKLPLKTLQVFSFLKSSNQKLFLLFLGKGELLKSMREYTKKNQIQDVKFLGFVPNDRLPLILSSADYYISTTGYESGQPNLSMLEAMASGLPIIVPKLLKHIVDQAMCGVAFDHIEDIEAYFKTTNYQEQSSSAIKFAENHAWSIIGDKYVDAFKS